MFGGMIQATFHDGYLKEECVWYTVVFIPKGYAAFRSIVLVEVMWKTVTGILNRRLAAAIKLYEMLHGFRMGRGTGTASLEANLIQHLMAMREAVLYVIFLELH